ncbi:hypothetical protein RUND412_002969 [Rhizina undulata]
MVKFDHRRDTTYEDVVKRVQKYVDTAHGHVKERCGALDVGAGSWWEVTHSTSSQNTNWTANIGEPNPRKRIYPDSDGQQAQKRIKLQGQTLFAKSNASGNEGLTSRVSNLSLEGFNNEPLEIAEDVMQVHNASVENPLNDGFQEFNVSIMLPFHRNPRFRGRVAILENMKQLLQAQALADPHENNPEMRTVTRTDSKQKTVILHGMGGAGKSQIALEFAYQFSDCYTSIFWIDADNVSRTADSAHDIVQQLMDHYITRWRSSPDYSEIANILGIPGKIILDDSGNMKRIRTQTAMKAVHNWLRRKENQGWLLLVDNHDNAEDGELDKLIPRCDWGNVVATTRLPKLHRFGKGIAIEGIGSEAGLELLLRSSQKIRESLNDSAQNIVRTLYELPLALDQAGAYIDSFQIPFSDYQEKLKEGMKSALSENALHMCAFLSNGDIPDKLFRRGKSAIPWIAKDENNLDDAIQSLFRLSLAKRKESSDSFWIHPLVHAWACEHTDSTVLRQNVQDTVTLVGSAFHYRDENWRLNYDFERRILTNLELCHEHMFEYFSETENIEVANACSDIAVALYQLHYNQKAEDLYQKALQWKEKVLGQDDPSILKTMDRIACSFLNYCQYDKAQEWYLRLLKRKEKALGQDDPSILETIGEIADDFAGSDKYDKAQEWYLRLLEQKEKALGQDV